MVAFFHTNPITQRNFKKAWQARIYVTAIWNSMYNLVYFQDGRRIGMDLKHYNIRIAKYGLRNTQWENCLRFFMDYNVEYQREYLEQMMLFSPEVKPAQLLKYEKKVPDFFLLGAVVENLKDYGPCLMILGEFD